MRGRVVALPIYNEEANLRDLLDVLVRDDSFDRIVAIDDCSSDGSRTILSEYANAHRRVEAVTLTERSGQLAAWRRAASMAQGASSICFIDADSMPLAGAVAKLFDALEVDDDAVIASGRVVPDDVSSRWAAARFRAEALHQLRSMGRVRDSIIGRFFAVNRDWFLQVAVRSDIIANDAFLGCSAARMHLGSRYVPNAVCRYAEARNTFDFAAQRQRADAGYAQLRKLQILQPQDEPSATDYARAILAVSISDPVAAPAWASQQLKARFTRAYRAVGRDDGIWEVQASTKRRLNERFPGDGNR